MIQVEHLTKYFGPVQALYDVSFRVEKNEVVGLLGNNGAGKTTLIRILTTYLPASSGIARLSGFDVMKDSMEVRKRIGYLPESIPLYSEMRVSEYLDFRAKLKGVDRKERPNRIAYCLERCRVREVARRLLGTLSKGYRQRVGLAQAILHEPEVLILDEPTSGLDPNQIAEIRGVIKQIGEEKTVIFSTHILGEVQATCSRVIIISDGKLVADGTPDELSRKTSGATEILVEVGGVRGNDQDPLVLLRHIEGIDEIKTIKTADWSLSDRPRATTFRVTAKPGVDPRGDIARVIATAQGMDLLQLTPEKASLEDIFRKLTTTQGAA